jgi:hypothetical protein
MTGIVFFALILVLSNSNNWFKGSNGNLSSLMKDNSGLASDWVFDAQSITITLF